MKMILGFLVLSSFLIAISSIEYETFADSINLSGSSHGNEISLEFSDGMASGVIMLEDNIINLIDVRSDLYLHLYNHGEERLYGDYINAYPQFCFEDQFGLMECN